MSGTCVHQSIPEAYPSVFTTVKNHQDRHCEVVPDIFVFGAQWPLECSLFLNPNAFQIR